MSTRRNLLASCAALASSSAANLPRTAPDFVFTLPDGKQRKLSDSRGKVVAVSFIATS
jgi:cytochrome oxidase Cu insertion factor (SCO1/SenC/PrrC family)